jgi:hypothetical protein
MLRELLSPGEVEASVSRKYVRFGLRNDGLEHLK